MVMTRVDAPTSSEAYAMWEEPPIREPFEAINSLTSSRLCTLECTRLRFMTLLIHISTYLFFLRFLYLFHTLSMSFSLYFYSSFQHTSLFFRSLTRSFIFYSLDFRCCEIGWTKNAKIWNSETEILRYESFVN